MPHTADVIVEAWGPELASCAEEAARGLLEICVSPAGAEVSDGPVMAVPAGSTAAMLEAVLEDLIYLFDTSAHAPVDVSIRGTADDGLEMRTRVAPLESLRSTGAAPKAIVMQSVETSEIGTRCRFIVDV